MTALAVLAAAPFALRLYVAIAFAMVGNAESARHNECRAIGWAAVSALFFIAGRLP